MYPGLRYPQRLDWSSPINAVLDGNSIAAGTNASSSAYYINALVAAMAPMSGAVPFSNIAIGGQTTRQMDGLDGGSSADVDAAWVSGKTNILVAWELTNHIISTGCSGEEAAQVMADYIAHRLAVHPWRVIIMTALPRYKLGIGGLSVDQLNANLDDANALVKSHWRTWGASGVCDVRAVGGPFDFPDYQWDTFERSKTKELWSIGDAAGTHEHLSDAGFEALAPLLSRTLNRLIA